MIGAGWFSRALYGALLRAYPRGFRARYGAELVGVFAEACRDSRRERGALGLARRWWRAVIDVPRGGLAERRASSAAPPPPVRGRGPSFSEVTMDLRYAARALRRRPAVSAAIITTLALAIGANTAMFSVIESTLLLPLPYRDGDRIVFVGARSVSADVSLPARVEDLLRWARSVDAFERLEAISGRTMVLGGAEGAMSVSVREVTTGFLDALGLEPLAGRFLRGDDGRADADPVVVISEGLWRRRFAADPQIVGSSVTLDGISHVVVGIAPDVRAWSVGFYAPLHLMQGDRDNRASGVAWLAPGVSIEAARAQLRAASSGAGEGEDDFVAEIDAPSNVFWDLAEYRNALLSLMAAVFLVLMIACVNVANLLLASGGGRGGELALRSALGATRGRLVRLMLVESLFLALAGGAAGAVLAEGGVRLMAALGPRGTWGSGLQAARIDASVLAYATLLVVVTGLAFGIYPARRGSATPQRAALQHADRRAGGRRLRGTLVAAETALCIVLLIAAGLTLRSFARLRSTDPGFDADRVMSVGIALPEGRYPAVEQRAAFFDDALAAARRLPGVTGVSLGYGAVPPSDLVSVGTLDVEGQGAGAERFFATVSVIDAHYIEVMGVGLIAGRSFDEDDLRDAATAPERVVVINRTMAERYWPGGDAIGARFRIGGGIRAARDQRWFHVVGIAADVAQRGLDPAAAGQLHYYQPLNGGGPAGADLLLRLAEGASPPVAELRAAINRIDPQIPTDEIATAAAGLLDSIAEPRFRAALFGTFAALAVALAALGISAVVSYSVSQRRREMGIRLALGARPAEVRRLVLAQGMAPVMVGIGLGIAGAVGVTRVMTSFLYGLSPTDPGTFAATALLLAAVALLATWIPARRATRTDPVLALRSE